MALPRINSRTPLHPPTMLTITPLTAFLMATFHSRKSKHRTTFVALLALVCLSVYIFVGQASFLAPPRRHSDSPAADQLSIALETLQNSRVTPGKPAISHSHRLGKSNRPTTPALRLDPSQELAAISSFLASLSHNILPPTVDGTRPVDPHLVLDFDTRSHRAQEEVQAMVEDVWTRNPVFLYSKRYSPASRELKSILNNLNLYPSPTIIDVDVRDDTAVLFPVLQRLLPFPELPVLLIKGRAVGSIEEVRELEKSGELQKLINDSGSTVDGAKRRNAKK